MGTFDTLIKIFFPKNEFKIKKDLRLLAELTIVDFKLLYKNSKIGYLWAIFKPLFQLAILYIVFSIFFHLEMKNYQLFLLIGIIIWNFFSDATNQGMSSPVRKGNLIKQVNFNRYLIVLSSCFSALITLALNLIVFFILVMIFQKELFTTTIMLPFYLILLFFFSFGTALILSSFYPKYRDLSHVWEIILLMGFWITPIIYPITQVPQKFVNYYNFNIMSRIINDARDAVLFKYVPSIKHLAITVLMVAIIFALGYWIFKKRSPNFAEDL